MGISAEREALTAATGSRGVSRRGLVRGLGLASIAGCVMVALTDVIGVLLHPGYNPLKNSISDLALGPLGWVQDAGLYCLGVGVLAFAAGLSLVLSQKWQARLGELLLLLIGIALLLAAFFHTDPPGNHSTLHGNIHGYASFTAIFVSVPAVFLVAFAVKDNRRLFIYSLAAGVFQVVFDIGRGRLPADWTFFGLHERLVVANALVWVAVVSWVLMVRGRDKNSEPAAPGQ
jgi:hypothetical membrane protein